MGAFLDTPATEILHPEEVLEGPLRGAHASMQGWRVEMEDAHILQLSKDGMALLAVFDGHGGKQVSAVASRELPKMLTKAGINAKSAAADVQAALAHIFVKLDQEMWDMEEIKREVSGTTAVVAVVTERHIIVANAGDSRSVLATSGGAKAMSEDHKPSQARERERIVRAGGMVTMNRVNGDLAVSRALGDYMYKARDRPAAEQMVSPVPDFIIHERCAADECLIIACDGIWDVMTNEEAAAFVRERRKGDYKLLDISTSMIRECLERTSRDNMTVVLLEFSYPTTATASASAIETDDKPASSVAAPTDAPSGGASAGAASESSESK